MSKTNNNGGITVSRQIAVYKTDKKLVEFIDKLNPAPITNYAHIHAQADDSGDGKKVYSLIQIVLQDYSNGTGDKTVRVTANISPGEARFIYSRADACVEKFEFSSDKIFGEKDDGGYSKVTKLTIRRATVGSDGKPRNYPWYLECENGRGIAEKNQNGGSYCKKGSFISDKKVFANLTDLDFFVRINDVVNYIRVWESQYGASVMISGKTEYDRQLLELKQESGGEKSA